MIMCRYRQANAIWKNGLEARRRSPKTEHDDGKDCRRVPIFPDLRPYLEDCFDAADDGQEYFITRGAAKSRK